MSLANRVASRWLKAKGFTPYPEKQDPDEDPQLDSWRQQPDIDTGHHSFLPGDQDDSADLAENDGRGWQWSR